MKSYVKIIIKIILLTAITLTCIQPLRIEGYSMTPTLNHGSWVIINKLSYILSNPKRGDVILIKFSQNEHDKYKYLVKRIIAIENDIIQIENGNTYVNNELQNENYIEKNNKENFYKRIVPQNNIFVLGDNRRISKDSRYKDIGFINVEKVIGKVLYWFFKI